MKTKALLIGSVGTAVESSALQLECYNQAFKHAGIDWHWDAETYADLLKVPGGRNRLDHYGRSQGRMLTEVEAAMVHSAKQALFVERLAALPLRDEALALLRLAGRQGAEVALVTTTEPGTAQVVADKLHAQGDQPLRCVVDRSQVQREKPQPDAYLAALRTLNIDPADAVAIEDTPESAASAVAANIECFGLPGTFAAGRAFPKGVKHIPCSAEQLLGQFSDLDALRATE